MPNDPGTAEAAASGISPGTVWLHLRVVARTVGSPAPALRRRVEDGTWPRPVVTADGGWYWPAPWVRRWVETGEWPPEARFVSRAVGPPRPLPGSSGTRDAPGRVNSVARVTAGLAQGPRGPSAG